MKTYIVVVFETKWEQAESPYKTFRRIITKAGFKRMPASIKRAKEWAETQEVKKSDDMSFTRILKQIYIFDGFNKEIVWERKEEK